MLAPSKFAWRPGVFLPSHAGFFGMEAKRQNLLAGDPLAFLRREGSSKRHDLLAVDCESRIAEQLAARK